MNPRYIIYERAKYNDPLSSYREFMILFYPIFSVNLRIFLATSVNDATWKIVETRHLFMYICRLDDQFAQSQLKIRYEAQLTDIIMTAKLRNNKDTRWPGLNKFLLSPAEYRSQHLDIN